MRHYPIFMDLQERRALVVGRGEVAERKAEALRRCGALVDIHPAFDPRALDGCALAVGAEAPEADLRALSAEARARDSSQHRRPHRTLQLYHSLSDRPRSSDSRCILLRDSPGARPHAA